MAKKPNIFEQRRRQIDKLSGWDEPVPRKAKPVVKKKPKKKGY